MAAVEVADLTVHYGPVAALRGVSFVAEEGTTTAVLGANGAGKTTLLRSMTGLVRPDRGSVRFGGDELTRLRVEDVVRRGVAHVPEGRGVIEELTVEENLRLGGLWRRRSERDGFDAVFELFPVLRGRRHQHAATLSGGERQALAIGRALMSRPKVLLLDEPSLGLAPIVTGQLMARLASLSRDEGITVVLVEQNARTALSIASRAVVLNLGRVVVADRAEAVAADTQLRHHYLGF
ncbi:MAG TPA: ABC transporter ATP-binding protein [Acidimicrobiales bacterium]|nr:ABC transporter ATP-binding protein [Acidimicrobiales bacterium]